LQQLSGKVAGVIFNRLVAATGNGRLTPEAFLRLHTQKLREPSVETVSEWAVIQA
jgi:3-methyladenine DNA glycosylase/8-oxoguanine DNA glycosylase